MKKANIILSAIGLLSVIGGALAFKAQHRFNGKLVCYTTSNTKALIGRSYTLTTEEQGTARLKCSPFASPEEYTTKIVTVLN